MYILVPKIPEVITKCLPLSNKVNRDFFFPLFWKYMSLLQKNYNEKNFYQRQKYK